jgi:hypothetical protein
MGFAHTASSIPVSGFVLEIVSGIIIKIIWIQLEKRTCPLNNIVRKQLYHQMAMMLGFIRHVWCVQNGIRVIAPSDEYMGHRWA